MRKRKSNKEQSSADAAELSDTTSDTSVATNSIEQQQVTALDAPANPMVEALEDDPTLNVSPPPIEPASDQEVTIDQQAISSEQSSFPRSLTLKALTEPDDGELQDEGQNADELIDFEEDVTVEFDPARDIPAGQFLTPEELLNLRRKGRFPTKPGNIEEDITTELRTKLKRPEGLFSFARIVDDPLGGQNTPSGDRKDGKIATETSTGSKVDPLMYFVLKQQDKSRSDAEIVDQAFSLNDLNLRRISPSDRPRIAFNVLRNTVQSVIDFTTIFDRHFPIKSLHVSFKNGVPRVEFRNGFDPSERLQLPGPFDLNSRNGIIIQNLLEAGLSYVGAGRLVQGLDNKSRTGKITRIAARNKIFEILFDGAQEFRIDRLAREFPGLRDIYDDWLSADSNDTNIEEIFKNNIEKVIPSPVAGIFLAIFRMHRDIRRLKARQTSERDPSAISATFNSDFGALNQPAFIAGRPDVNSTLGPDSDTISPGLSKVGEGTFINFARFDSAEDIKSVRDGLTKGLTPEAGGKRMRLGKAALSEITPEEDAAYDAVIKRNADAGALSKAQIASSKLLLDTASAKLFQLAAATAFDPSNANIFGLRRMILVHHAIQKDIAGDRAGAQKLLAALPVPAALEGDQIKAVNDAAKRFGGDKVNRFLASQIAALARNPNMTRALFTLVERAADAKTIEEVQKIVSDAVLGGTVTQLSQPPAAMKTAFALMDPVVRARVARTVSPDQFDRVQEAAGLYGAVVAGAADTLIAFGHSLAASEIGQLRPEALDQTLQDDPALNTPSLLPGNFLGRFAGHLDTAVPNSPAKLPGDISQTLAYQLRVRDFAFRKAAGEVQNRQLRIERLNPRIDGIIANPPSLVEMDQDNQKTFAAFAKQSGDLTKSFIALSAQFPGVKFMVPFVNAEANLKKFELQDTPLAPIMRQFHTELAAGGTRREVALTKMSAATAITFSLINMAQNGTITGGGAKSGKRGGKSGARPYTITLGGKQRAYDRTSALGANMCLAADLVEIFMNTDMDEVSAERLQELAVGVTAAISTKVTDLRYLQQLAETMIAASDPQSNPESYLENFAGNFLVKPGRRAKTRRAKPNPFIMETLGWMQGIKAKLPGVTKDAPKPRDEFGRDYQYRSGLNGGFSTASPIYDPAQTDAPIDREVRKQGFNIQPVEKVIRRDGDQFFLRGRPDIVSRLQELRGQVVRLKKYGGKPLFAFLNDLVSGKSLLSDTYNMATDGSNGGKGAMIHCIINDYQDAAEDKLVEEFGPFFREQKREIFTDSQTPNITEPPFRLSA